MVNLFKDNSGFSLLEIIVASAIASIILLLVTTSYRTVINSIKNISGHAELYENVNLAISKIDRDISNAFVNRKRKKVCFIGNIEGDNSKLNFVSVNHNEFNIVGSIKKAYPVSDIRETGYFLREDREFPGVSFLIRREEAHYDDDPENGGEESILLENVIGLKFEFRQRNDWIEYWDSRQYNRFPRVVKTTLLIKNYQQKEENFVFISYINMNQ